MRKNHSYITIASGDFLGIRWRALCPFFSPPQGMFPFSLLLLGYEWDFLVSVGGDSRARARNDDNV